VKHRCFPILIFLIALVLRLVPVLLSYDLPIGLDDMFQYDMLARSIVAGNGFRWYAEDDLRLIRRYLSVEVPAEYDPRGILTSFRAPGYPAFLALVYAVCGVGGRRLFYARLAQTPLGAALAPLTWALARQIGFGEQAARWAAVAIAAFPLLVVYPLALVTENLFVPLLMLGLALVLRASEKGQVRDHALAGLVLGLAALTRSVVAGLVPLIAVWLWWTEQEKHVGFRNGVALILCFLLITVPWAVRNTYLHDRPTWVESALGYDLYLGYHPQSTGTFQYGISLDLMPLLDDGERHTRGMEAFRAFLRTDPGRVPYLTVRKAGHLWGLDKRALTYFYSNNFLGRLPAWLLGLMLLLACGPLMVLTPAASYGLVCGRMERRKMVIALFLIYYTGAHMLILAEPRFHVPLLPVIATLATYVFIERPWHDSRPWQRWLAILLIALLLTNWGLEIARDWDILVKLFGPAGYRLYLPY
jgi:4-amino-4-deoxy-L-arabinose transferase-like glycosyltransferase